MGITIKEGRLKAQKSFQTACLLLQQIVYFKIFKTHHADARIYPSAFLRLFSGMQKK